MQLEVAEEDVLEQALEEAVAASQDPVHKLLAKQSSDPIPYFSSTISGIGTDRGPGQSFPCSMLVEPSMGGLVRS